MQPSSNGIFKKKSNINLNRTILNTIDSNVATILTGYVTVDTYITQANNNFIKELILGNKVNGVTKEE